MRDPALLSNPGQISGVHVRLGALSARLASIEAARGYINGLNGGVIAPGTINGSAIVAGSITTGAIAAGAITADLILAGAIEAGHIQAGAIGTDHLAALSINAGHIQSNAIQAGHIGAGTITGTHIAAGTITAQQIAAGTITAGQLAANTITADQIATGTITAAQIAAGTITANELAAASISANHLQANAVTANSISANSIYTAAIQAGAVTSDKVTVATLSALTSNMGSITAGTITGATFQTSASGSRVVMDSLGMRGYALDGVTKVFEINSGSGVASFTGIANIDPLSVIPGGTITTNTMPGDRIVAASIGTTQLAAGSITANTIAAGAVVASKISVEFGGNNILYNSSFEDSAPLSERWGVYQGYPNTPTVVASAESVSGVTPRDGTKVCRVERLGSGTGATYASGTYGSGTYAGPAGAANHAGIFQTQKALPGQTYTMSIYAMIPASRAAQMLTLYVADSGAIGGYWDTANTYSVPNDGVWRRYSYTFVYSPWGDPGNATTNVDVFYWMANAATNALIYFDGAQMEPGEIALAYSRRPGEVLTGEIGSTKITPNSITTNEIMASTIQGGDIAATTITGLNIQGSSIGADKLSVTTLSAITADMGAMTAGTITGAVIRTAASGTRITLDSTGFKQFIGAAATPAIHFKTDGSDTNEFTGIVNARGVILPGIVSAAPTPSTSIIWKRASDSVVLGDMAAHELGANGVWTALTVRCRNSLDANNNGTQFFLSRSSDLLTDNYFGFQVPTVLGGQPFTTRFLLRGDQSSDYAQMMRPVSDLPPKSKQFTGAHSHSFSNVTSSTTTVTHGLIETPTYVHITQQGDPAAIPPMSYQVFNITSTTFQVRAYSILGVWSGTDTFAWTAHKTT